MKQAQLLNLLSMWSAGGTSFLHNRIETRQILHGRDLLRELISRDIKIRYKRSVIGTLWTILNPLAQLMVLNFVFTYILPTRIPNFVSFLLVGILAWTWFSSALEAGTGTIVSNAAIIKKPAFPNAILPIVSVSTQLVHFLLALPILFVFVLLGNLPVTASVLALPLVITTQFLLILSLVFILATVNVSFRDTKYLLRIVLMLGFYLTPIFYDPEFIPDNLVPLYNLNPMVHVIGAYRSIFLEGQLPSFAPLVIISLASCCVLFFGYRYFKNASYKFVEDI
jgi:lipopolysaccharide transport system permease protein